MSPRAEPAPPAARGLPRRNGGGTGGRVSAAAERSGECGT